MRVIVRPQPARTRRSRRRGDPRGQQRETAAFDVTDIRHRARARLLLTAGPIQVLVSNAGTIDAPMAGINPGIGKTSSASLNSFFSVASAAPADDAPLGASSPSPRSPA
jgi:hypothetical protein